MINAVNVPVQTVAVNSPVLFASTKIKTGCSARHEQGSGRFVAIKPGQYMVDFSGNVSIPTGGTVVPIVLDLVADGDAIAGSRILLTPAAVNVPQTVQRSIPIQVYCDCCASLTVRNDGTAPINIQDASFTLTRLS